MTATVLNTPLNARVSLNGAQWCFARVNNNSTVETIRNDDVNCGHVDPEVEGDAVGRQLNRFIISLDPSVPMLTSLLPKMGLTLDTGTYKSDLSLSSMAVVIDYGATAHSYAEAWIDRWVIRGGTSTLPVSIDLHCVAGAEVDAGPAPSMTEGDMGYMFGFPGAAFSVAGSSYDIDRFVAACQRNLIFEFNSSNTITGVGLGNRQTLLATSTPYLAGKKAVYWGNKTFLEGRAVSLTLTNGINNIAFAMPKARLNPKAPDIMSQTESIRLPLTWEARRQVGSPGSDAFTFVISEVTP